MEALGFGPPAEPEVLLGQLVKLVRDGERGPASRSAPATSSRSPTSSTRSIPTSPRMTFLLQGIDSPQTFDLDIVTSQSMENPVYYVQYAHARVASIARRAAEARCRAPAARRRSTSRRSCTSARHELLRALALYPDVVAEAAETRAPQKVTHLGARLRHARSTASTATAG